MNFIMMACSGFWIGGVGVRVRGFGGVGGFGCNIL